MVISSQICGNAKRLFFAVLEKEPEIKCREIPVTVYDHEENKITDLQGIKNEYRNDFKKRRI